MKKTILLTLMPLWWVVPIFILHLINYSPDEYIKSYILFFIVFASTFFTSSIFYFLEKKYHSWENLGYWNKYLIINGAYCVNILLILIIYVIFSSYMLIEYFGSCPAGSFGMLLVPSVLFYLFVGIILGLFRNLRKMLLSIKMSQT